MSPKVQLGIEAFFKENLELVRGKNIGIVTNQSGILSDFTLNVDFITNHLRSEINLKAIFAPEQGFRGNEQAGFSSGGYIDPQSNVTVYDLYEKSPDQIKQAFIEAGIDVIIFDIQDAGARFYTYIWTLADIMEGIAGSDLKLIVTDRPNPLGGQNVAGPLVKPGFESFVGRYPIPLVHGLTVGELAVLFNEKYVVEKLGKSVHLHVSWMKGWNRDMYYDDTGLPFLYPSINLPTLTSVLVYPGQGLFEGLDLSEGRGTTHPFEIVGAPFMDYQLSKELNKKALPGVHFIETHFTPVFSHYAQKSCTGVQVYITDRKRYDPLRAAVEIMTTYRDLYPKHFKFLKTFGVLCGSNYLQQELEAGKNTEEIINGWQDELNGFKQLRSKYLHY
jgi:uncharacterized protein YbbC (DUF1343 family)